MTTKLVQVSATGDVHAGSGYLKSVTLTPAAALSTVAVRLNGAGGAVVKTMQVAASGASVVWASPDAEGVLYPGALHATVTGAGVLVDFEIEVID